MQPIVRERLPPEQAPVRDLSVCIHIIGYYTGISEPGPRKFRRSHTQSTPRTIPELSRNPPALDRGCKKCEANYRYPEVLFIPENMDYSLEREQ